MLIRFGELSLDYLFSSRIESRDRPREVFLTFEFVVEMKATEQYFPVVLFIMLYKVVLTFESVDEILKCDHSNESGY